MTFVQENVCSICLIESTSGSDQVSILFFLLKSRIYSKQNNSNTNAADDLVRCVAMSSAAMVLTKGMNRSHVLHGEGFQLPMSSTLRNARKCCIHVQLLLSLIKSCQPGSRYVLAFFIISKHTDGIGRWDDSLWFAYIVYQYADE